MFADSENRLVNLDPANDDAANRGRREERLWTLLKHTPCYWQKTQLLFTQSSCILRSIRTFAEAGVDANASADHRAEVRQIANEILTYRERHRKKAKAEIERMEAQRKLLHRYAALTVSVVILVLLSIAFFAIRSGESIDPPTAFAGYQWCFQVAVVAIMIVCLGQIYNLVYHICIRDSYISNLTKIEESLQDPVNQIYPFRRYKNLQLAFKSANLDERREFLRKFSDNQLELFEHLATHNRSILNVSIIQAQREAKQEEMQRISLKFNRIILSMGRYIRRLNFAMLCFIAFVGGMYGMFYLKEIQANPTTEVTSAVKITVLSNNKAAIAVICVIGLIIALILSIIFGVAVALYSCKSKQSRKDLQEGIQKFQELKNSFRRMAPRTIIKQDRPEQITKKQMVVLLLRQVQGFTPMSQRIRRVVQKNPRIYRQVRGYTHFRNYFGAFNLASIRRYSQIYLMELAGLNIENRDSITINFIAFRLEQTQQLIDRRKLIQIFDAFVKSQVINGSKLKRWLQNARELQIRSSQLYEPTRDQKCRNRYLGVKEPTV